MVGRWTCGVLGMSFFPVPFARLIVFSCVLGEMFTRRPILPGSSDAEQLDKIWQLCGSPNQHNWPNHDLLPGVEGLNKFVSHQRRIKLVYEG